HVVGSGASATLELAESELVGGLSGLTGAQVMLGSEPAGAGAVIVGTPASSSIVATLSDRLGALGSEGYLVEAMDVAGQSAIVVAANSDVGVLYGSFALLRHVQMHRSLQGLSLSGDRKSTRLNSSHVKIS